MLNQRFAVTRWNAANDLQIALVPNATNVSVQRNIGGTDSFSFLIPRNDPDVANLAHGTVLRVRDTMLRSTLTFYDLQQYSFVELEEFTFEQLGSGLSDIASGRVAGVIDLGDGEWVRVNVEGFRSALATALFPPGFVLSGNISTAANKLRLTQRYDWRHVTAAEPAGFDGDEIVSWIGDTGGTAQQQYLVTDALVWEVVESGADNDSAAALMVLGQTSDSDGNFVLAPYNTFGQYASPFYDFKTAFSGNGEYDRVRLDIVGDTGTVRMTAATFKSASSDRMFPVSPGEVADPQGVGHDLTALSPDRYIAVYIDMAPELPLLKDTPVVRWFQIIGRRDIPGVRAGTFPSGDLEDQLSVAGQSLLQVLDGICGAHHLEWRLQVDGTLDVQTIPQEGYAGSVWGDQRTADCTFVEGIHCAIESYEEDDSNLVNYLVAQGTGGQDNQIEVVVQDTTSQSDYGLFQKIVQFNEDTIAGLKVAADDYLATYSSPDKRMTIRVRDTPAHDDQFDFEPGDTVRVVSRYLLGHDGETIDETLRIVEDEREEIGGDLSVRLTLNKQRHRMTADLAAELDGLWQASERSVQRSDSGSFWTPERTDGAVYTETILLDFTPTHADADAIELYDATSGNFYSPHGGTTQAEVLDVLYGERKFVIRYARTSGSDSYQLRVHWNCIGRVLLSGTLARA